jgi:tetratricopeptide (TPR) repeat protein
MAVFGIPVLHEDDALRAVRAAAGMRDALAELNADLERDWGVRIAVRIGVNTGQVVAGDPSGGQNLVTGDTVNTAARLEQAARPGEILIGDETYRLTRDAVEVEPVDPLALKGKADAVDAFRLLEVRAGALGHERRMDSPMVGRERPLRMLRDALEGAVADRACYLFTVLGPAGMGKSRLVREFLDDITEGTNVLQGRCLSYGDGITFWPVAEMVTHAAGIADDDDPPTALHRIEELLAGLTDGATVAGHLGALLGVTDRVQADPGWALRRLFEHLADHGPLVVVFDDIHWAEPLLLGVIEQVVDWSRDAPILVVCLARPEFLEGRPGWGGGKLHSAAAQLEPLGEEESDQLIHNLLGLPALTQDIRERIRAAAQGNPLFVEEMLSMLLDDGVIVEKDGDWVATVDLSTVQVPPAISALLAARLDKLSREERTVIECASVIGEVFERAALRALAPEHLADRTDDCLLALLRKDLVRRGPADLGDEEGFRFRHILIRDAAYDALPKQDRAGLHERVGDWIETTSGDRADEFEEFIGYHLEQAYRYRTELSPEDDAARALSRRAAERLASAGRRARGRADIQASFTLLSRAMSLLPPDDPERLAIALDFGAIAIEDGSFASAIEVLEETVERAVAAQDDRVTGLASVDLLTARMLTDPATDVPAIGREADRLIAWFEERGDDLGAARAWRLRSYVAWMGAKGAETAAAAERAIDHARRAEDQWEITEMQGMLIAGLASGPTPFGGVRAEVDEVIRSAQERGNRKLEASALRRRGEIETARGEFDRAEMTLARAMQLQREIGMTLDIAAGRQTIAHLETSRGNHAAAEEILQQGYEELDAMHETSMLSTIAVLLAHALIQLDRDDDAEHFVVVAEETATQDDIVSQVGIASLRGLIHARGGRYAEGERFARRAVDVIDRTDFADWRGRIRLDLGEVLRLSGKPTEAVAAITDAIEIFERKGEVVAAETARAALAALQTD